MKNQNSPSWCSGWVNFNHFKVLGASSWRETSATRKNWDGTMISREEMGLAQMALNHLPPRVSKTELLTILQLTFPRTPTRQKNIRPVRAIIIFVVESHVTSINWREVSYLISQGLLSWKKVCSKLLPIDWVMQWFRVIVSNDVDLKEMNFIKCENVSNLNKTKLYLENVWFCTFFNIKRKWKMNTSHNLGLIYCYLWYQVAEYLFNIIVLSSPFPA